MREDLIESPELPVIEALVHVECADGSVGVSVVGHVAE